MFFRQKELKESVIRCMAMNDLMQTSKIAENLQDEEVLIIAIKDFRIRKPLEYRRLLNQLRAYMKELDGKISLIGSDYLLLVPKTHELVLEQ